jgi:DNA polymerase III delta prime subunit
MEIIGHKEQCERLTKLKNIPHAILFTGPEAVGKKRVARWFAKKILGKNPHPDLHLVQLEAEKRDIPATALRELIQKLQLKSYAGGKKIAIIDDAHRMSIAASNAFLKTLEEPPGDSLIILITHCPQMLLPTIISRCQTFNFSELNDQEKKGILESHALEIETKQLLAIGELSILGLSEFIDPISLELKDKKKATNHLNQLLESHKKIKAILSDVWEAPDFETKLSNKVATASKLAEDKDNTSLVFGILKQELRARLRTSNSNKDLKRTAEQMLKVIEIEQLTQERSLNSAIQLAAIL